jgi:light-regulated signal transduction histidine kinase (bacteriophytochrome)
MIDDLVVFARFGRQDLNRRRVDLTNLVNLVIREMRLDYDDSGLKISVSDLGYADVDASLVKQVFVNLLRNAVKFSRQRPDATIEVGRADVLGDGNWTYFVKDNGAGFAMKDAERLFGIFQRLHSGEEFEGTGVGLAIAQRIVHRHGGHIWAESAPQAGATFRFTLRPSEVLWRLVPMAVARAADGEPKEAGSGGEVHSIQEARSGSRP